MGKHKNFAILGTLALLVIGLLVVSLKPGTDIKTSTPTSGIGIRQSAPVTGLRDIADRLNKASKKDRPALLSVAEKIAKERQAELAQLAKTQPARVIEAMMSLDELAALPPEIRALSEKPFNGVAHIDLQWITYVDDDGSLRCTHRNVALVGNNVYEIAGAAYQVPKSPVANLPIDGYLLGDTLLLESSGIRNLSPEELLVADQFFPADDVDTVDPITGQAVDPEVAAVIGGRVHHFENESVLAYVREELGSAATTQQGIPERKFAFIQASGGDGSPLIDFDPAPLTTNTPKVLFIRAKFPVDAMYPLVSVDPITANDLSASLSNVNGVIQKFSYGAASITATVTPETYTLATPAITVATEAEDQELETGGSYRIIQEARAAAAADLNEDLSPKYNLDDYDIVAVYFPSLKDLPGSNITYGGLATTGGKNHWINGVIPSAREDIITHEFGHNYGLNHSNYLDPMFRLGGSYFNMVSLDYGDVFDKMSIVYPVNSLALPTGNLGDKSFFNPYETSLISWMPPSKITEVSASGTYRIFRFDHANATSQPCLALRVPMGGNTYNWVALRASFDETKQSAYITNEGAVENTSNLVDATPNSNESAILDRLDAALPVSSSYRDNTGGVTFTTMAAGGTGVDQYIDVKVDFDNRIELASTNVLVDEAAGNAALVVNRKFNSLGSCSVSYTTTGGTATSGTDFHATTGTLTWADGDTTSKTIFVPIRPDNLSEGAEAFTLTLSSPTNAVIPPALSVATITILDAGSRISEFAPPFFNTLVDAILPLPDGKVLAGGLMSSDVTGHIARFNADGSEDTTFLKGSGFDGAGVSTKVLAIARQQDGKLVVGGEFRSYNGTNCSMITRLNSDGTTDTSFCTAIGTGADNRINTIGLQADGKILLGGDFTTFNGTVANGLVRLTSTGARDLVAPFNPNFNVPGSIPPLINDILVQDDGKVMIAGQFTLAPDGLGRFRFGIARLTSSGVRDDTFDPGYGSHLYDTNLPSPSANNSVRHVRSVARQRDGKYVIGGNFTGYDNLPANFLIRINANGSRDNSFVPPAIVASARDFTIEDIQVQPSGRILAAGRFSSPAGRIMALLENGSVDPGFSFSGGASNSSGGNGDIQTIALDSRSNIYLGGNFFNFAGSSSRPIVKIAGGVDSYSIWLDTVFTPAQIAAGNTGSEQDFDNDGILNIAEMALGLSPTVANSAGTFAIAAGNLSVQTSGGSSQFLTASMQRSAANVGVWLVAQFSSDLTNWLPVNPVPGSNATYDVTESTSTRFTVRDKTASGPGVKRFVRFRAVVPN